MGICALRSIRPYVSRGSRHFTRAWPITRLFIFVVIQQRNLTRKERLRLGVGDLTRPLVATRWPEYDEESVGASREALVKSR